MGFNMGDFCSELKLIDNVCPRIKKKIIVDKN